MGRCFCDMIWADSLLYRNGVVRGSLCYVAKIQDYRQEFWKGHGLFAEATLFARL